MMSIRVSKNSHNESFGNSYILFADEGVELGIFFRLPIRKVIYSSADYYNTGFYISDYIAKCQTKLGRLWQYILGNKQAVNDILDPEYFENEEYIGLEVNKVVSPIYFRRNYRTMLCLNMDGDAIVEWIDSRGYNDKYTESLSGCNREVTKIHFKYKKTDSRIRTGKNYLYTNSVGMKELVKIIESKTKVTEEG
mgnify:FL=1